MILYVKTPTPGSTEARGFGCSCPAPKDYGTDKNGWPLYAVDEYCPIHKATVRRDAEQLRLMNEFQARK